MLLNLSVVCLHILLFFPSIRGITQHLGRIGILIIFSLPNAHFFVDMYLTFANEIQKSGRVSLIVQNVAFLFGDRD